MSADALAHIRAWRDENDLAYRDAIHPLTEAERRWRDIDLLLDEIDRLNAESEQIRFHRPLHLQPRIGDTITFTDPVTTTVETPLGDAKNIDEDDE